jgi:hypothetical protein
METPTPSTRRNGWFWTILKCLILMAVLAAGGALALHLLMEKVVPPWFVPRAVFEWLMEHVRPYALVLGAAAGGFVGFLGSVGVVIWDARKGRLTRVR